MKSCRIDAWQVLVICVSLLGLAASGRAAEISSQPAASIAASVGQIPLPLLPYPHGALEPYVSARTVSFHYSKHHQAYVDNLNKLITGTTLAGLSLEQIIVRPAAATEDPVLFNNAAQAWNHNFFWQSMKQDGGGKPTGKLLDMIVKSFGSFEKFKEAFVAEALAQFGSGWVWLIEEGDGVKIVRTANADTPVARGQTALLTCDVWEHAYYLDYQNRRKDFVQAFLEHLVNWEFAVSKMR